jgi:hypothetical protein
MQANWKLNTGTDSQPDENFVEYLSEDALIEGELREGDSFEDFVEGEKQ